MQNIHQSYSYSILSNNIQKHHKQTKSTISIEMTVLEYIHVHGSANTLSMIPGSFTTARTFSSQSAINVLLYTQNAVEI